MMNFREIQERREQIAAGPVFAIPEEKVAELVKRLGERTPRSRELFHAASQYIPGGAQHMLANRKPHPLTIERALDSRVWDVDGHEYIDFLMMAGPIILGHGYPPVVERVAEAIRDGTLFAWTAPLEIRVAERVARMTGVDKVHWLLYIPPAALLFAGVTGICPGYMIFNKLGFKGQGSGTKL